MDKNELIKFKYRLECIKNNELKYKINKFYTIINPSDVLYGDSVDISLYELEENIDVDGSIKMFEKYQEDYISDSIDKGIIFDEMRVKIYYLLLVDKYELEMLKNDCSIDNREYDVVPKEVEYLDNICIIGGFKFELYKENNIIDEKFIGLDNDNVVYYDMFKKSLTDRGYDEFKIGDFNDLGSSVYDNRRGVEEISVKFKKSKIKTKN